ncbi:MAG: PASTA domain-containing protein [Bacteroidales bacterium]
METKKGILSIFCNIYIRTILIAIAIVILIVISTLVWLNSYTRHNQAIAVPDLRGLDISEAATLLRQKKMRYQVVDSVFARTKTPGSVVEQTPAAEALVKEDRIIFLTVNAREQQKVEVPNLRDNSYRQAVATLRTLGFEIGEIIREASEYRDLVIDIKFNNQSIANGTLLPFGSKLNVVIGDGMGESHVDSTLIIDNKDESWFQ